MNFFIKNIFDYSLAFVVLIFFLPILLIISLTVLITMGKPILFRQLRVGRHGKPFYIYKFRTMTSGHTGSSISVKGEKRITPVGEFLRKFKLDEFPEFYNVLKGDMSFVGPRPDVPGYADSLKGEDRKILELKPGITGPASLKYIDEENVLSKVENPQQFNDEVIYPDKVRINLNYLNNWSLELDLKIIYYTLIRKRIDQ